MTAFKDHFSSRAADYAAYRPTYPPELVDYLASVCPTSNLALDCGCGTGQLAVLLADRFKRVIATDASTQQIENAEPRERVTYRVAPAERSDLPDASADLVVAAQAAHCFDRPAFYAEARRVGRPGAVLALVTYGVMRGDAVVNPVIQNFYENVVGRTGRPSGGMWRRATARSIFRLRSSRLPPGGPRLVDSRRSHRLRRHVVGGARRRAGAWTLAGRRLSS